MRSDISRIQKEKAETESPVRAGLYMCRSLLAAGIAGGGFSANEEPPKSTEESHGEPNPPAHEDLGPAYGYHRSGLPCTRRRHRCRCPQPHRPRPPWPPGRQPCSSSPSSRIHSSASGLSCNTGVPQPHPSTGPHPPRDPSGRDGQSHCPDEETEAQRGKPLPEAHCKQGPCWWRGPRQSQHIPHQRTWVLRLSLTKNTQAWGSLDSTLSIPDQCGRGSAFRGPHRAEKDRETQPQEVQGSVAWKRAASRLRVEPPNICTAALGRQHTKRGVTGKLGSVSLEKGHVPAGAIQ